MKSKCDEEVVNAKPEYSYFKTPYEYYSDNSFQIY